MDTSFKPSTDYIAANYRDDCVGQTHQEVLTESDVESKPREYQQIGKEVNPKTNRYIDTRLNE
jgi:hypothetical protein